MNEANSFLGCFASLMMGDPDGESFKRYIWGTGGLSEILKKIKFQDYGSDLRLVLFQFHVNPIPYAKEHLKMIESYRKKEKSIGINIIVDKKNFFSKSENERRTQLRRFFLEGVDLLSEIVRKKKLDTKIELLRADLLEVLAEES